jgi:hypothetical protein
VLGLGHWLVVYWLFRMVPRRVAEVG